ncbi:MAG: hypothetical protein KDA84_29405 [Planctomycetaceae bacterium]|nr:hypothetical protein [Planctomycetaceae bacterium]
MNEPRSPLNSTYGLLAFGSSRCWDVAINETLNNENEWIGEIEGPNFYTSFQLDDLGVLSKAKAFLAQRPIENQSQTVRFAQPSLVLGKFGQSAVSLFRDDEYEDRCFFVVEEGQSCIRITLLKNDIRMLEEAFSQLQSDLE